MVVRNQAGPRRTGPDSATNARALPIYQTTSYVFDNTDHAAALFGLAEPGNIYTRIMNPTQDAVEQRIAALEGGVAALLVASGQAAESFAILNLAEAGDHIVSSPRLYGGTYNLFHYTLPKLGITVDFVEDPDNLDHWREAIRPNTKAFYGETISNPKNDVFDIPGISAVAHEHGIPLIVDNTVATPYLIQPLKHGADIVVHSATKYLGGHGTAIAGVIVDGGTFDWTQGRHTNFTTPDPSYHGVTFADLGAPAYALKARVQLLRDLGSAIAPFNAFLISQGIETLSLRIERHVSNAQKVAEFLEGRAEVTSVAYAGLESSPWHERGKQLAPKEPAPSSRSSSPVESTQARSSINALTCTATSPTSVTFAHSSSTPRRRRTRSSPPRSSSLRASRRGSSASRSASKGSTTFSPTSKPVWPQQLPDLSHEKARPRYALGPSFFVA